MIDLSDFPRAENPKIVQDEYIPHITERPFEIMGELLFGFDACSLESIPSCSGKTFLQNHDRMITGLNLIRPWSSVDRVVPPHADSRRAMAVVRAWSFGGGRWRPIAIGGGTGVEEFVQEKHSVDLEPAGGLRTSDAGATQGKTPCHLRSMTPPNPSTDWTPFQ